MVNCDLGRKPLAALIGIGQIIIEREGIGITQTRETAGSGCFLWISCNDPASAL
jgi:hypothetical protein